MADIVRRDPFELGGLRQMMERMFDEPFFRVPAAAAGWDEGTLPVDISEAEGKLVVRASLPGFKKEDIETKTLEYAKRIAQVPTLAALLIKEANMVSGERQQSDQE